MLRSAPITSLMLLIMLLLIPACKEKEKITGKAFMERETLVDVLADIHLADGVTNDRKFNRKFDADSIDVLSPILDKHQVSREMFDTTLLVYSQYPEIFDQVYNDVLIKLNLLLDENDKVEVDPEQIRKPSI